MVVLCFVENIILFGTDKDSVDHLYHEPGKQFCMKNLGRRTRFFGFDIIWTDNGCLKLNLEQLIQKLLNETVKDCSKSVGSPVHESSLASSSVLELIYEDERTIYCTIVKSLMYTATRTRTSC